MSRRVVGWAFGLAILCVPSPLSAQKLVPAAGSLIAHDVTDIFLRVSNRGGYGLAVGPSDVGNFPRGSTNRYLFGAGLWVGGIGDVDADGQPDTLTTIGFHPTDISDIEWVEGAIGFSRDDPRFRVLSSTNPSDMDLFPVQPVADQELFTMYGDRFTVPTSFGPSIPLGLEVRQRSFVFDEADLSGTVFVQYDMTNISDRIRSSGYTIREPWAGIVLDPDLGDPTDDTAARLEVDGQAVLLIWDSNFQETSFEGTPGFLAIVPLVDPGAAINVTQLTSSAGVGVRGVPVTDATEYLTLAGLDPRGPTIRGPGFDLRALVGWKLPDVAPGSVRRTAVAFVWADAPDAPAFLAPADLQGDESFLSQIVARVRTARQAYADRLANLPPASDFPGEPPTPEPGETDALLQNHPNPFRDETTFEYRIEENGSVRLEIFDVAGSKVATLFDGRAGPAVLTSVWDGKTDTGRAAPAGVYIARLTTPRGESVVRALKLP